MCRAELQCRPQTKHSTGMVHMTIILISYNFYRPLEFFYICRLRLLSSTSHSSDFQLILYNQAFRLSRQYYEAQFITEMRYHLYSVVMYRLQRIVDMLPVNGCL